MLQMVKGPELLLHLLACRYWLQHVNTVQMHVNTVHNNNLAHAYQHCASMLSPSFTLPCLHCQPNGCYCLTNVNLCGTPVQSMVELPDPTGIIKGSVSHAKSSRPSLSFEWCAGILPSSKFVQLK